MKKIFLFCLLIAVYFPHYSTSADIVSRKTADTKTSEKTGLTLNLAEGYIAKALACGRKNNWKLSVAVVNSEGNLIAFQRDDGSYFGSVNAAIDKATSASAFQRPTKAFVDAVKDGRVGILSMKNVVPNEGGMPIQLSGKHVGAIGISGARAVEDEQCAIAALE